MGHRAGLNLGPKLRLGVKLHQLRQARPKAIASTGWKVTPVAAPAAMVAGEMPITVSASPPTSETTGSAP
jgi:hypothetical protein